MVLQISKVEDIKWFDRNLPIRCEDINLLKKFLFKLPKKFIDLLKISNGGYINYDFNYYDEYFNEVLGSGISEIYGIACEGPKIKNKNYDQQEILTSYHDLINNYNTPPEFFPQNLLAFGSNGGGNCICFDYRSDQKTNNPPVVYWNHGADEEKDVSFVANNFEEFIKMLKEPEGKEEFNEEEFQQWLKSLK
jgi:hypothetical protein